MFIDDMLLGIPIGLLHKIAIVLNVSNSNRISLYRLESSSKMLFTSLVMVIEQFQCHDIYICFPIWKSDSLRKSVEHKTTRDSFAHPIQNALAFLVQKALMTWSVVCD